MWVRREDNSNVRKKRHGPGQGTSTASKTTDGPHMSPLGDHKYDNLEAKCLGMHQITVLPYKSIRHF